MISAFLSIFFLVFVAEIGDKTMLLAFLLAAKFKKPAVILFSIFLATICNHAFAAYLGAQLSQWINPLYLKWGLGISFILFGFWTLIPDKPDDNLKQAHLGAFLTTFITFFLAEMGDKTQIATMALSAHYKNFILVTFASSLGLLAINTPAVILGQKIEKWISFKTCRIIAAIGFFVFGILSLFWH